MQVYLLQSGDDEGAVRPTDGAAWAGLGGVAFTGVWPEPALVPYAGVAWRELDCLGLSAAADGVLLSERARQVLAPFLAGAGELWPCWVLGRQYWWLNVLAELDALGIGTEGEFAGDLILEARRLVFDARRVGDATRVFRMPELPSGWLFVREGFVSAVLAGGLTGFGFELVWSLDGGGVLLPVDF